MSKILDSWGSHLTEQALLLLQKAEDVAETQGASINVLHVLFIILTNKKLAVHEAVEQTIAQEALVELINEVQQNMRNDALYLDLDMYRLACDEEARKQSIQISDALILEQLLEKSYTIEQLLLSHNIALQELMYSTQALVNTAKRSTDIDSIYLPSAAGALDDGDIKELLQEVKQEFQIPERSSLAKIDDAIHSNTLDTVLGALESIVRYKREQVIVFCGQNGSAIDVLEEVLAYRLGLIHNTTNETIPLILPDELFGYTLWKISLNTLRELYGRNRRLHPAVALKLLKQEAVKAKAILLLSEWETLSKRSAVNRKMREQMHRTNGACIIGLYMYYDQVPEKEEVRLGLDNVTLITSERVNDSMIFGDFIKRYHIPRWEESGYMLEEDTFDSLFILEPGIWIDKQRKTFPYLAIGLADDCARTLRYGAQHVLHMAADARVALKKMLEEEAPQTSKENQARFSQTLEDALVHVNNLYDHPEVKKNQGKIVITRALIEAQLFCRNNSEFHFPGFLPWTIPMKRQEV